MDIFLKGLTSSERTLHLVTVREKQIQEIELRELNKNENTKPDSCIIFRHSVSLYVICQRKPEEKQQIQNHTLKQHSRPDLETWFLK